MAASNESQGLKIAVAIFVSLTVVLLVSSYFLYSSYSQASSKLKEANDKVSQADTKTRLLDGQLAELRQLAGFEKFEDFEALKAELTKTSQAAKTTVQSIDGELKQALTQIQAAGGADPKIAEIGQLAQSVITSYNEPQNSSLAFSVQKLSDLLKNSTRLTGEVSRDNAELRRQLAINNEVAAARLAEETKAMEKAKQDLAAEHDSHEENRKDLLVKLGDLQTKNASQATQLSDTGRDLTTTRDVAENNRRDFTKQIKNLNYRLALTESVMDRPDGAITFIDFNRGEVRVDVRRSQGARPMMHFSIFDRDAPGIPSDKPKGTIELISVGDRDSIGRIIQGSTLISNPLRVGDVVYSPAWSPSEPIRYALIGKIDLNRDGRDDRADVIRLIEEAGGKVEYDLPPPNAGQQRGELTPSLSYFVVDEQEPLVPQSARDESRVPSKEFLDYKKKEQEAIEKATLNGTRPIPLRRLAENLGYKFSITRPGHTEGVNDQARDAILYPKGRGANRGAPAPAGDAATPPAPTTPESANPAPEPM